MCSWGRESLEELSVSAHSLSSVNSCWRAFTSTASVRVVGSYSQTFSPAPASPLWRMSPWPKDERVPLRPSPMEPVWQRPHWLCGEIAWTQREDRG